MPARLVVVVVGGLEAGAVRERGWSTVAVLACM